MTLEEKFENILHNWIDKDYNRQHVADELGTEAEEFAIGFAEWLMKTRFKSIENIPVEKLLEIYKKTLIWKQD